MCVCACVCVFGDLGEGRNNYGSIRGEANVSCIKTRQSKPTITATREEGG